MKIRWLIALLALATAAAHAQIGLYATFDASRYNNTNVFLTPPAGSDNTAHGWLYGPTFGFYDDFIHAGPLHLGADVRADIIRGNSSTRTEGLVGLRASIHAPAVPIKPYVQGSVGIAHSSSPGGASSNNLSYRVAGGVDFTILPRIDWRVIEVGRGGLVNYAYGTGINQSNSLLTLGTGIVLRLP